MSHSCEVCGKFLSLSALKDTVICIDDEGWEYSYAYPVYAHKKCQREYINKYSHLPDGWEVTKGETLMEEQK